MIDNGFTLLKFSEFWKIFFDGAAIVVAVTIDALVKRRFQDSLRRRRRAEVDRSQSRGRCRERGHSHREAGHLGRWEALLVVLILAAGVWSWTLSSFFLRRANLLDLMTPYVFIGLAAFGLTFVVIAGEIDISVMSIMAVAAVSIAEIWSAGVNIWLAALAGLVVAAALGLVNGVLVGLLDLPSLAVTLGTLAAFRGLAFVILGGSSISGLPTGIHERRRRLHLERAAGCPARAARLRARARRPPARDPLRPLPLHDRLGPGGRAFLRRSRGEGPRHRLRGLRPDGGVRGNRVPGLLRLRPGRCSLWFGADRRRHGRRARRRRHLRRGGLDRSECCSR